MCGAEIQLIGVEPSLYRKVMDALLSIPRNAEKDEIVDISNHFEEMVHKICPIMLRCVTLHKQQRPQLVATALDSIHQFAASQQECSPLAERITRLRQDTTVSLCL